MQADRFGCEVGTVEFKSMSIDPQLRPQMSIYLHAEEFDGCCVLG